MTPKPVLRRPGSMPRMRVATLADFICGPATRRTRHGHAGQRQAGEGFAEHTQAMSAVVGGVR
jgi:hypothetical protein